MSIFWTRSCIFCKKTWRKKPDTAAEIQKEDFKQLMETLNSLYAYNIVDTDEYSKRQLFVLGGIWGAMGLYQKIAEKKNTDSQLF